MANWLSGRINRQPAKEEKPEGPLYTIRATPNEIIALNVAIAWRLHIFRNIPREQETNRLLQQFQRRLFENLPPPETLAGGSQ